MLTGRSTDIFYVVISCRRKLKKDLAEIIGESIGFDGNSIFNMNAQIDPEIGNYHNLKKFRRENTNNKEYFTAPWSEGKDSVFIRKNLIYTGYFSQRRYAWEVNSKLDELGRKLNRDLLSKHLRYFVKKR